MKLWFVIAVCLLLSPYGVFAQDERLVPSYSEDSQFIYDHPDVDIDVYPYVNSWKNARVHTGHGGFAEQPLFTRGDPNNPPQKGAVLTYIKAYNHGFLYGNRSTEPKRHNDEQAVVYVMSGFGLVEAGDKTAGLKEGTAIFIPAGIEYHFQNTSSVPLEVIIIVEGIPDGFTPRKEMAVKSYYDATPGYCCWAYTIYSLFGPVDGLAEPMSIAVITVNGLGMGSPHYHVDGCEEIWLKLKGDDNLLFLGKKLLRQEIGEAFLAPPNGLVPHSVINQTDREMAWLYMGNRHDK